MLQFNYPIGFHEFQKDVMVNFQLNRWYASGAARLEDLMEIGGRIQSFGDWQKELIRIAETAEQEERWLNAATYFRAAEFVAATGDPMKEQLYDRCMALYEKAYRDEPIERHQICFGSGFLPVMKVKHQGKKKGTIVMHGGYDSFIVEFYPLVRLICDAGYEVYLFEGPGQGEPLHHFGMKMTPEWEKPVSAVLDYFSLSDITLIGVSLGGYLAARAAAYEPRISRVVLYDIVYDLYGAATSKNPPVKNLIFNLLLGLKAKNVINKMERKIRSSSLFADWMIGHGCYVFGAADLYGYVTAQKQYNTKAVSPLIRQDVLLMAGEDDIYTIYFEKQKNALKNARSTEGRIFTRAEHASHHCQVGNLKLAIEYILDWIDRKS